MHRNAQRQGGKPTSSAGLLNPRPKGRGTSGLFDRAAPARSAIDALVPRRPGRRQICLQGPVELSQAKREYLMVPDD
jgi:hypothetical protein